MAEFNETVILNLKNNLITNLDLSGSWSKKGSIDDKAASRLADALKCNTSLKVLNLGYNQIGDAGAAAIGDALKYNDTLVELGLDSNQIGDAGAAAIADALKYNCVLSALDMYNNQIGDAGAAAIADALKINIGLTVLDIHHNQIGDAGAAELLAGLVENVIVQVVNCSRNKINNKLVQGIKDQVQKIKSLPIEEKNKIFTEKLASVKRFKKQEEKKAEAAKEISRSKALHDANVLFQKANDIKAKNPKEAVKKCDHAINLLKNFTGDEQDLEVDTLISKCYACKARALTLSKAPLSDVVLALEEVRALGELSNDSIKLAVAVLAENPDSSEVLRLYLGETMLERGDKKEALKYLKLGDESFDKAWELKEHSESKQPDPRPEDISNHRGSDDMERIKKILSPVQKLYADAGDLFNEKKYSEAARKYKAVIQKVSKFLSTHEQKDNDDFKENSTEMLLDSNIELAHVLYKLKSYDEALKAADEALKIEEFSEKAKEIKRSTLIEKGLRAENSNNYIESLDFFNKALNLIVDNQHLKLTTYYNDDYIINKMAGIRTKLRLLNDTNKATEIIKKDLKKQGLSEDEYDEISKIVSSLQEIVEKIISKLGKIPDEVEEVLKQLKTDGNLTVQKVLVLAQKVQDAEGRLDFVESDSKVHSEVISVLQDGMAQLQFVSSPHHGDYQKDALQISGLHPEYNDHQ